MIYKVIVNFYLTDEQLKNSSSRKDGIDEATETTFRIYGYDLIQESGILLKLPEAVATGQKVAASCLWLASKPEESPRKARQVLIVFHTIECEMENLQIEHLEIGSQKYHDLKTDLSRTERYILKEMGFVCHVEHPFISNYLAILKTPPELRQEAWNLANDSMEKPRTMEDVTDRTKPWQLSEILDAVQCRLVTMPRGTDSSRKATANVVPQHWQPNSGLLMANDVSGVNLEESVPCVALSKNDS
nr:cyclin-l1-1 [Quercus suber]